MNIHEEIDLGATNEERYGVNGSAPLSEAKPDDKKYYPSFHYSGKKELHLPEDGKMTVEYCVTSETSTTRNDEHYYECTIEVRKILNVEGESDDDYDDGDEAPTKVEDILDGLMEKLRSEKE
jgi:hypothetical protein